MSSTQRRVQRGHNHGRTMTRDQVEAHLTLRGWIPLDWGQGGAAKGDVVVYTTKTKVWEPRADEPSARFNVHTIWDQDPATIAKNALDCWLWSDPMFWKIATECLSLDSCAHIIGHDMTNALAFRCARCHQLL